MRQFTCIMKFINKTHFPIIDLFFAYHNMEIQSLVSQHRQKILIFPTGLLVNLYSKPHLLKQNI